MGYIDNKEDERAEGILQLKIFKTEFEKALQKIKFAGIRVVPLTKLEFDREYDDA